MEKSKWRGKGCPLDFPFIRAQGKLRCIFVLFVVCKSRNFCPPGGNDLKLQDMSGKNIVSV